jgi:hypothetical protein
MTFSRIMEKMPRRRFLGLVAAGALLLVSCGIATRREDTSMPEKYPSHSVTATIFWVGEGADSSNANIDNISTEWDSHADKSFGGIDDPYKRSSKGLPKFKPKQNPYYIALPASEFDHNGLIKGAREHAPWYNGETGQHASIFKGKWVKITRNNNTVFAQWLDTGPGDDPTQTRDYSYVFGDSSATPRNKFGLKAGIDLSPTAAHDLGFSMKQGKANVTWRFVEENDVPPGPWLDYPKINNKVYW